MNKQSPLKRISEILRGIKVEVTAYPDETWLCEESVEKIACLIADVFNAKLREILAERDRECTEAVEEARFAGYESGKAEERKKIGHDLERLWVESPYGQKTPSQLRAIEALKSGEEVQ